MTVRALRGATTLDVDEPGHMTERVQELVRTLMAENQISAGDMISVIFTATPDIHSMFPAKAARELGLDDVPLLGAQELDVERAMPLCVRLLAHVEIDKPRDQMRHVFQYGATQLRTDLVPGGQELQRKVARGTGVEGSDEGVSWNEATSARAEQRS